MTGRSVKPPLRLVPLLLALQLPVAVGCGPAGANSPAPMVETIAGDGVRSFGGDGGPATDAQLNGPYGIAFDSAGHLYFSDHYNHRIRRVDVRGGGITTVAGTGRQGFSGDGGPAFGSELNGPSGVAIDRSDNIFFADRFNQRVRRIDGRTGVISTVAGDGSKGFAGDGGPATRAALNLPLDVRFDGGGNLFIADLANHRIRRIDARSGIISTVAGDGRKTFSGDGEPAQAASLDEPHSIQFDGEGNLYISDHGNHRIRRVDSRTRIITTFAGSGNPGFGGDGGLATEADLQGPHGMVFDQAGNLLFSDSGNDRIRRIHVESGIIETTVGTGGTVMDAELHGPYGIDLDPTGDLYIAEFFEQTIRRLRSHGSPPGPTRVARARSVAELARLANQIFGAISSEATIDSPALRERVALGRRLFFDRRLSRGQELRCASCHDLTRGGIDGKSLSPGHRGRFGEFNTPTVFNASLQDRQFWNARAGSLEDQAREVLVNPIEMAMHDGDHVAGVVRSIPAYGPLFARAFPDRSDPITYETVTVALAEFQRRLITPAPIDQFMRGNHEALDERQRRGLELFIDNGCAACHTGHGFGGITMGFDRAFPAKESDPFVFLDHLGRRSYFKVPQLRNVAVTAPYLHDGSVASLEETIRARLGRYAYGLRPVETTPRLDDTALADLIAFLDSLTGEIDPAYTLEPETLPNGSDTPGPDPS